MLAVPDNCCFDCRLQKDCKVKCELKKRKECPNDIDEGCQGCSFFEDQKASK